MASDSRSSATAGVDSPIEIAGICVELRKLGSAGILQKRAADACNQAAPLLEKMREFVLDPALPPATIIEKLKWMLVQQGEG